MDITVRKSMGCWSTRRSLLAGQLRQNLIFGSASFGLLTFRSLYAALFNGRLRLRRLLRGFLRRCHLLGCFWRLWFGLLGRLGLWGFLGSGLGLRGLLGRDLC